MLHFYRTISLSEFRSHLYSHQAKVNKQQGRSQFSIPLPGQAGSGREGWTIQWVYGTGLGYCDLFVQDETKFTPTIKAYKNLDFLNSRQARSIRIMCEFEEPRRRLRENFIQVHIPSPKKNDHNWLLVEWTRGQALAQLKFDNGGLWLRPQFEGRSPSHFLWFYF